MRWLGSGSNKSGLRFSVAGIVSVSSGETALSVRSSAELAVLLAEVSV
jgi:hypothetical protein